MRTLKAARARTGPSAVELHDHGAKQTVEMNRLADVAACYLRGTVEWRHCASARYSTNSSSMS